MEWRSKERFELSATGVTFGTVCVGGDGGAVFVCAFVCPHDQPPPSGSSARGKRGKELKTS